MTVSLSLEWQVQTPARPFKESKNWNRKTKFCASNRAERALRFIVIARDTGQYAKNDRGAEAYAAFASVIRTAMKTGAASLVSTLHQLFDPDQLPKQSP